MSKLERYARYPFQGLSAPIVNPVGAGQYDHIGIGHAVSDTPWVDPGIHIHTAAEEFYVLLRGQYRLWVAGSCLTLKANEILMVQPNTPHAIVGGEGAIEHFILRAPNAGDKQSVGDIPTELPDEMPGPRELRGAWGCRIPLLAPENQNCWLIGSGQARFASARLCLAYLDFPTFETANAGLGTRHRLHYHQASWEYYIVLQGTKKLQIEDEQVAIQPGEILEVPPGVWHTLYSRQAPYRGFTVRAPLLAWDDKVEK
jgi:mannose-6-phosphate isomerase-like protein (cupin superfamily)